jgi:uncharacterized protein Yka (UPF0111/DUF47 family)
MREIDLRTFYYDKATFVTPLDREDISGLASSIDEVLDFADGVADRFLLFKVIKPSPHMPHLSEILSLASQEIYHVLKQMCIILQ